MFVGVAFSSFLLCRLSVLRPRVGGKFTSKMSGPERREPSQARRAVVNNRKQGMIHFSSWVYTLL